MRILPPKLNTNAPYLVDYLFHSFRMPFQSCPPSFAAQLALPTSGKRRHNWRLYQHACSPATPDFASSLLGSSCNIVQVVLGRPTLLRSTQISISRKARRPSISIWRPTGVLTS